MKTISLLFVILFFVFSASPVYAFTEQERLLLIAELQQKVAYLYEQLATILEENRVAEQERADKCADLRNDAVEKQEAYDLARIEQQNTANEMKKTELPDVITRYLQRTDVNIYALENERNLAQTTYNVACLN